MPLYEMKYRKDSTIKKVGPNLDRLCHPTARQEATSPFHPNTEEKLHGGNYKLQSKVDKRRFHLPSSKHLQFSIQKSKSPSHSNTQLYFSLSISLPSSSFPQFLCNQLKRDPHFAMCSVVV